MNLPSYGATCRVLALGALALGLGACWSNLQPATPAPVPAPDRRMSAELRERGREREQERGRGSALAHANALLVEDDMPRAVREAARDHKLLLVEAWAPWCHTCLSMRNYVLPDPLVTTLAERVLFAAIDTDRPQNADFVARYPVEAWPTFFVIDPIRDELLGHWQGSVSAAELRQQLLGALDQRDAKLDPAGPVAALLAGERATARGDGPAAVAAYERALASGGPGWPRRSEAEGGLIAAEHDAQHWQRCAELGVAHLPSIVGSSLPADTAYLVLECATKLGPAEVGARARTAAIARLREHTAHPPAESSIDDRADALDTLSDALREQGRTDEATALTRQRLALLEQAAHAAPTPEMAATFDYGRMNAYLALGRGEEALAMLQERIRQLPDAYEPRARLGEALDKLGRSAEALAAIDGALERAYGPRKLRYLRLRADLLGKLGRAAEQHEALRALVGAYDAMPHADRDARRYRELVDKARAELGQK
jgi:tetratricopeptide (TPR) repeat protein